MAKVKHTYQGKNFRGEWSEEECRLSLRYEGPEGTVEGTATVGSDGRVVYRSDDMEMDGSVSAKLPGKEVVDGFCVFILSVYLRKYETLGKDAISDLLSEWARQNPD